MHVHSQSQDQTCSVNAVTLTESSSKAVLKKQHASLGFASFLGKWYTRPSSLAIGTAEMSDEPTAAELPSDTSQTNEEKKYCYCKKPDDGSAQMIGCDNPKCPFCHTHCLKRKHIP